MFFSWHWKNHVETCILCKTKHRWDKMCAGNLCFKCWEIADKRDRFRISVALAKAGCPPDKIDSNVDEVIAASRDVPF